MPLMEDEFKNKSEDLSKPIPGLMNVTFDYFFPLNTIPPIDYPVMLPTFEVGAVRIEHREGMLTIDKGHKPTEENERKLIHRRKHKGGIRVQYNGGTWNYVDTDLNGSMKFTKLFTRVQIIFPVADLRANPAEKDNRDYIEKIAKSFFDKFLMSYMYGVGDFAVRPYEGEESDWPVIKWLRSYDYTQEDKERLKETPEEPNWLNLIELIRGIKDSDFNVYRGYEGTNGLVSATVALSDYSNITKKPTSGERCKKAATAMANPTLLPPYYDFLFSSIRRAHLDKEYHLAIVDLATCFEIILAYCFSIYNVALTDKPLRHNGEMYEGLEKEAEAFDFKRLHSKKESVKDTRIRVIDELKKRLAQVLEQETKDIYGTDLWNEWYEKVWEKRNSIVHSGNKDIKAKDIQRGVELTQDLLKMVEIDNEAVKKIIREKFQNTK